MHNRYRKGFPDIQPTAVYEIIRPRWICTRTSTGASLEAIQLFYSRDINHWHGVTAARYKFVSTWLTNSAVVSLSLHIAAVRLGQVTAYNRNEGGKRQVARGKGGRGETSLRHWLRVGRAYITHAVSRVSRTLPKSALKFEWTCEDWHSSSWTLRIIFINFSSFTRFPQSVTR